MQKGQFTRLYLDSVHRKQNVSEGGPTAKGRQVAGRLRQIDLKTIKNQPLSSETLERLKSMWLDYFQTAKPQGTLCCDTATNLRRMELVGAELTIVSSHNPTFLHRRGVVISETEGLFGIQTTMLSDPKKQQIIYVPKEHCIFQIHTNTNVKNSKTSADFIISGKALNRDVATRTKTKPRRLWSLVT